jgi:hypothetical protein
MALSLERFIWYDFNSFLHVEIFVEESFFPAKKLLDEHWKVVVSPSVRPSGIQKHVDFSLRN